MFEIDCSRLNQLFSKGLNSRGSREAFLDYELFEECEPFFSSLKEHGHISQARNPFLKTIIEEGDKVPVFQLVFQFDGLRFKASYSVNENLRVVTIENFEIKHVVDMNVIISRLEKQLSSQDFLGDIPQADRPTEIIRTLEFIHIGYNTALEIGERLGHRGVKQSDIRRHGCYKLNAAINLGLAERYKKDCKTFYRLTDRGQKIADLGIKSVKSKTVILDPRNKDISTQYRLMIEAMLGYYPVRLIFDEIVRPQKGLKLKEIQSLIDTKIKPGHHSPKTSFRRARCLMTWMCWMTMVSGIPVFREDSNDAQLVLKLFPEIKVK